MIRTTPLVNGEVYHVYTRSIARFVIFNHPNEFARLRLLLAYCRDADRQRSLSNYLYQQRINSSAGPCLQFGLATAPLVRIIAWCLMPTHIHLVLQQLADDGITAFMHRVITSYSKFFNALKKRKGPLWETRFQNRHVNDNDYFLHLTRYVHLNPVKAGLAGKAEEWEFSSYREYLGQESGEPICNFERLIPYSPATYRKFTEDHATYAASKAKIGHLLMDDDSQP